jgi:hypothetical protein
MISAVCVFGPMHGQIIEVSHIPTDQPFIVAEEEPTNYKFNDDEVGSPKLRMPKRHMYELHDIFEQGVEECAVLFHKENCCDKTYADRKPKRW